VGEQNVGELSERPFPISAHARFWQARHHNTDEQFPSGTGAVAQFRRTISRYQPSYEMSEINTSAEVHHSGVHHIGSACPQAMCDMYQTEIK
jgi:hypothetical protein